MRGVSLICLLLVVLGARAWVVEKMYLDNTCSAADLFTTTVISGVCQEIDSEHIRFTCAGSDIIAQSCYDSACVNCETIDFSVVLGGQAGTCINFANLTSGSSTTDSFGFSFTFECDSQFPTINSGDLVAELFFTEGCSGDPFSWTIAPSSLITGSAGCSGVQSGVCISDSSAGATEGVTVMEKVYCDGFTAPTGTGNGPVNCTVDPNSCSFYWDCVETTLPCASTDYALAYGYVNCITYQQNINAISAGGQVWLADANKCMQTQLKTAVTASGATCASVRSAAFAAHTQCYLDNTGTCFPAEDWSVAMSIAYDAAITANGTVSALTSTGCFANYSLAGVWRLTNVQAGSYHSLLTEIAALAGVNYSSIAILDSTTKEYTWKVGYEVKRGFGLGSGGLANVTFTASAPDAATAAQVAATFNTNFQTQTTWSGAHATNCTTANPGPCAVTETTATYGAEPPASTTTGSSSSSASFLAASAFAALSFFLLL